MIAKSTTRQLARARSYAQISSVFREQMNHAREVRETSHSPEAFTASTLQFRRKRQMHTRFAHRA